MKKEPRKAVYTAAKRAMTHNTNSIMELLVKNCSVKEALKDSKTCPFRIRRNKLHKQPLNALWRKYYGSYPRKILKNGVWGITPEWDAAGRKGMIAVHFVPVWALHIATWVNCLPDRNERLLWFNTCLRGTAPKVMGQIVRASGLDELGYPLDFSENDDEDPKLRIHLEDGDNQEIKAIEKRLTKVSKAAKKAMLTHLKNRHTKQYWVGAHYWTPAVLGGKEESP